MDEIQLEIIKNNTHLICKIFKICILSLEANKIGFYAINIKI
jgi:hypothetical protein